MKRALRCLLPALAGAAVMWLLLSRCLVLALTGRGGEERLPPGEMWTLTAPDGTALRASVQEAGENWAILVHGWGETGAGLARLGETYQQRGWSVLIPDLRGCGESGGARRGLGVGDGADLLLWVERIRAVYPEAGILLHGRGLGANAALTAAGERPEGLIALVAEDPVESLQELAEACAPGRTLLLWGLRAALKLETGRDLPSLCVRRQTAGTGVPILFLTGENPVPADAGGLICCAGKGSRLLRLDDRREREEAVFAFLTASSGFPQTG